MSTDNSHKSKARAAQKKTGESYMRARRSVDNAAGAPADPDDSAALLALLGFPSAGLSADDIAQVWAGRDLPAGTGAPVLRDPLLRVPLGVGASGEPLWLDMKEAAAGGWGPHAVVAGVTGSGKTSLLQAVSFALCVSHSPETLKLVFFDALHKGHTGGFDDFVGYPNVKFSPEASVEGELDDRYRAFQAAGVASLAEYQALRATAAGADLPPIPYLVTVIDGIEEMSVREFSLLERLWRQGRSVGIHTLCGTQAPTACINLSNVRARIALKAGSPEMSRAILGGNSEAYSLPPTPGEGLLWAAGGGNEAERFRGYRVSRAAIRDAGRLAADAAAASR